MSLFIKTSFVTILNFSISVKAKEEKGITVTKAIQNKIFFIINFSSLSKSDTG